MRESEDKIFVVEILGPQHDFDALVSLFAVAFARNVVEVALGITAQQLQPFFEVEIKRAISAGLSFVALNDEKEIVAAFLNEETKDALGELLANPAAYYDFAADVGTPPGALWQLIEDFPRAISPEDGSTSGRALHISTVVTRKDYERRGLCQRLVRESYEFAKDQGFTRVYTECTAIGSKKAFLREGFEEKATMRYSEWEYPKGSNCYPLKEIENNNSLECVSILLKNVSATDSCD